MTVRSFSYDAATDRIRIGVTGQDGSRSYRALSAADEARARAFVESRIAWLEAREPGIQLRSLRLQIDEGRALLTLAGEPPRAITLEGASYQDFAQGIEGVVGPQSGANFP